MGWTICHVNLAAHDVREASEWYTGVFGSLGMEETKLDVVAGQSGRPSDKQHLAYFEDGTSRSIHIAKPDAEYARERGMWINPTAGGHLAIRVDDVEAVKAALDARKWTYYDAGEFAVNSRYSLYLFDPSWNMLEVNQPLK
jgi:catechol 2,3-dioxygenase-like lactoylglutathione lyase family enzyme